MNATTRSLRNLTEAIDALLVGIAIHNGKVPCSQRIEGPVVTEVSKAHLVAKSVLASIGDEPLSNKDKIIDSLDLALRNILAYARREQSRINAFRAIGAEDWQVIIDIVNRAGIKSSVLRDTSANNPQ